MVRFKLRKLLSEKSFTIEFQSHNGSIQTPAIPPSRAYRKMFQSHNGSIQTSQIENWPELTAYVSIPQWFDSNMFKSYKLSSAFNCFNPTMVRFKLLFCATEQAWQRCFNPTMVRFKRATLVVSIASKVKFQSHNGSIQTRSIVQTATTTYLGFNPTMVRFKHGTQIVINKAVSTSFNPTMVRFKLFSCIG